MRDGGDNPAERLSASLLYMWHSITAYNAFYKIERVLEVNVNGISLY